MFWFIALVYLIAAFGISTILIDSVGPYHIFEKWHNWMVSNTPMLDELFSCYVCLPCWIGIVCSLMNLIFLPDCRLTPANMALCGVAPWWVIVPLDAAFTSGGVWLIHTFQSAAEKYADS